MTKEYTEEDIISFLGESFHTAFRKAVPDSEHCHKIWMLIREMPNDEWGAILEWVYWSMGPEYADAFRVVTKGREK